MAVSMIQTNSYYNISRGLAYSCGYYCYTQMKTKR